MKGRNFSDSGMLKINCTATSPLLYASMQYYSCKAVIYKPVEFFCGLFPLLERLSGPETTITGKQIGDTAFVACFLFRTTSTRRRQLCIFHRGRALDHRDWYCGQRWTT